MKLTQTFGFCLRTLLIVNCPNDRRHFENTSTNPVVLSTLSLRNAGADGRVECRSGGGAARDQAERKAAGVSEGFTLGHGAKSAIG